MVNKDEHDQILQDLEIKYLNSKFDYFEFVKDGPCNWNLYTNSFPRILFLVKEARNSYHPSKPGQFNDSVRFMANILRWANYTHFYFDGRRLNTFPGLKDIKREYDSIAIVEVKKLNQEKYQSSNIEIETFAEEDKFYLKRQIEALYPNVIFCCGTLNSLDIIYQWDYKIEENLFSVSGRSVWRVDNRLVIDFKHPSIFPSYIKYPHLDDLKAYSELDLLFQNDRVNQFSTEITFREKNGG